ncbi:MAG: helix-turn-helix domain-containing protein [bacterium]|nr:ArsR family transcriptional regulator [Candidatus Sumerlaeota bacterium]
MTARINCVLRTDLKDAIPILKVLSNPARCAILEVIADGPQSVSEITTITGLDQATVSQHIQALEKAGLVRTSHAPGVRGRRKMVQRAVDNILLHLPVKDEVEEEEQSIEMPIGLYTDIRVEFPCGFLTAHQFVFPVDTPSTFLHPDRVNSELIWLRDGFIEYSFPYTLGRDYHPTHIEVSAEVCSETIDYKEDFPSDLTVWINGIEIGMVRMPGDMGARYGAFTPSWIPKTHTKYGFLNIWSANKDGFWVNQFAGAPGAIGDLNLSPSEPISVRFGFKEASIHGGLNIFGAHFGDFDQAIRMRIVGKPSLTPNERLVSEVKRALMSV